VKIVTHFIFDKKKEIFTYFPKEKQILIYFILHNDMWKYLKYALIIFKHSRFPFNGYFIWFNIILFIYAPAEIKLVLAYLANTQNNHICESNWENKVSYIIIVTYINWPNHKYILCFMFSTIQYILYISYRASGLSSPQILRVSKMNHPLCLPLSKTR